MVCHVNHHCVFHVSLLLQLPILLGTKIALLDLQVYYTIFCYDKMALSFSLHRPLLATIALLWLSCAATAQNVLSPQQFKDMVATGEVDLILDVRTPEEWNQGHIEQATFVNSLGRTLVDTPALLINSTLLDLGIFACMHCRVIGTYHTSCISENVLRRFVLISSLTVVYLSHSLRC